MPERIQLSRRAGWRKADGAVVVSRPSKWGNPFVVGRTWSAVDAVAKYRAHLDAGLFPVTITKDDVRRELRGKDLACWCKPGAPCHADVLLEVANR